MIARMAAAGRKFHHAYATEAAGGGRRTGGRHQQHAAGARLRRHVARARAVRGTGGARDAARGTSLRYLEKLRLFHAATTAVLTAGLLAWAILLWRQGSASTGDVVLVTTMGFTILHGTRDLAVALVDITQHVARLAEALDTLLVPHELPDAEDAQPLQHAPRRGDVRGRALRLSGRRPVLRGLRPADRARRAGRHRRPLGRRASPPCWRCCSASARRRAGAS